jgi:hypothetical protein
MGFGSKDDGGTPRSITQSNSTIVENDLNLSHADDLALVRTVRRLPAAHRRRTSSINRKFEMKDGCHDTGRVKQSQYESMMEIM